MASPAKPDKERVPLTPAQLEERLKINQASYTPVYTLLCNSLDRFEQALDGLTMGNKNSPHSDANIYAQLASSIQNQSLNVLDILRDELTRNVTAADVDSFF